MVTQHSSRKAKICPSTGQKKEKKHSSTKQVILLLISFVIVFNRFTTVVQVSFRSLTKWITPEICRLCVCVLINKRSFEPVMCSKWLHCKLCLLHASGLARWAAFPLAAWAHWLFGSGLSLTCCRCDFRDNARGQTARNGKRRELATTRLRLHNDGQRCELFQRFIKRWESSQLTCRQEWELLRPVIKKPDKIVTAPMTC